MLGDFEKWLEASSERYDLVVASGVLYHRPSGSLIELMSQRLMLYLWTHFSTGRCPARHPPRRFPARSPSSRSKTLISAFTSEATMAPEGQSSAAAFDEHSWLEKQQILPC